MSAPRWALATATGLLAGLATWLVAALVTHSGPVGVTAPDGLPPADPSVRTAADALGNEPLHVDPLLADRIDDADRAEVVDRLAGSSTFVTVVRSGLDDGYGGRLAARAFRTAEALGRDGRYIVVDQDRHASGLVWTDGRATSLPASLPEGSLASGIVGMVDELDEMEANDAAIDDDNDVVVGALVGGPLLGLGLYGVGRLLLGVGRMVAGWPFTFPGRTNEGGSKGDSKGDTA